MLTAHSDVDAQGLSHEIGYNLEHYQRATALEATDSGAYYAIQYQGGGFTTSALLYSVDTDGELLWSQPFNAIWGEVIEIHDILHEGGFIYIIGSNRECCDCTSAYSFAAKYSLEGDLIWVHSHKVDSFDWFNDFFPRNISQDSSANLLYELKGYDDFSVLIRLDDQGLLLDSIPMTDVQGGSDMLSLDNGNIAFLKDSMLYKLNSIGELQETVELTGDGISLMSIADSLFVLQADHIEVLDGQFQSLGILSSWDNAQALGLRSSNNVITVQLHASNGILIQELSIDGELLSEDLIEIDVNDPILFDSNSESAYILEPFQLTEQSSVRYRSFDLSINENQQVLRTEVEPLAIQVNESSVTSFIAGSWNIVTIGLDLSVLVKNNGLNELTSCRLNRYLGLGICALSYFTLDYNGISLTPGDSTWIDTGVSVYYQNAFPIGDTISYTTCVFTSNPNGLVDLEVTNDEICDTFEFILTDIPEYQNLSFSFFPNPASNLLYIDDIALGDLLSIYDLHGRLVLASTYNDSPFDVGQLEVGVYLMQLSNATMASKVQRMSIFR